MNNKLFVLTKMLLKSGLSFPTDNKKRIRQVLLTIALIICFVPMAVGIAEGVDLIYEGLVSIGEEGVILSLGITSGSLVIFFFGLFYTMNTFYFSNDIEDLLPLPVKPASIMGSKFIVVIIYEYLTEAVILLPILISFGIKSNGGILYYLYALFIFLTVPIIPIVVASLIVMIIMRFTNIAKNKDRFKMFSSFIAIFLGVGVNIFIQRMSLNQGLGKLQLGNNSLVEATTNVFLPAKIGTFCLLNSENLNGLVYIVAFLAISLLGFYLFLLMGNMVYYKGVIGISTASSKKKRISQEELSKKAVRSSAIKTYIIKEMRVLFRTPPYFINCILMNFLWPVLLALPFITGSNSTGSMGELAKLLQNDSNLGMVIAVAFGIILFISSSNGITATAISREGDNIFVNKYIPLSYKTQIMAKVISGVIMGVVGMLTVTIASILLLKLPFYQLILIFITGILAVFFSSFIGVLIDLVNPKLHWDNEQKAVKQNINLLLSMLISAIFAALNIFLAYKLKLNTIQIVSVLILLYGILNIVLYKLLMSKGIELFKKMEQ